MSNDDPCVLKIVKCRAWLFSHPRLDQVKILRTIQIFLCSNWYWHFLWKISNFVNVKIVIEYHHSLSAKGFNIPNLISWFQIKCIWWDIIKFFIHIHNNAVVYLSHITSQEKEIMYFETMWVSKLILHSYLWEIKKVLGYDKKQLLKYLFCLKIVFCLQQQKNPFE